mmetsp:Transcript_22559/g.49198  ORF Transcript_22559/g.49198 Transcript_22559/m.49198 type:complete len:214 (+) Transcript_22559:169-810(+)|eukprot:CAMPEP_0168782264 /NCGR_PEP_ID=MMETSP0725-20121227/9074_1 /TAXON_ID=265536 /ORGANISM="Amphiprora sp., Strain CCMP467" /LENGTH=213 /DNA_ID=CAMNT_0008832191 /DNA_START=155 /DNA_END=796 /DNA_ORIENTATION=+
MGTAQVVPKQDMTQEHSSAKLDPNAQAFRPSSFSEEDFDAPVHLCIFNDGVPSLVLASEADVSDLLHGINDDAIDESFPPTAEEAAELDAVEEFVEMMASLDYMEQREERARVSFDFVKKRWETRRAEGLKGRPKPAKHSVDPAPHGNGAVSLSGKATTDLVKVDDKTHHSLRMLMKHQKLHQKELRAHAKHNHKGFGGTKQRHPIQQPRKLN